MFSQSNVLQLFPVLVWAQQLEDETAGPLTEHLLGQLDRLRGELDGVGPTDPWQTRNDLQTDPEFDGIAEVIRVAAENVIDFLNVAERQTEITGMWVNIKPTGHGHSMHMHPNNFLSGVYYVAAPPGGDGITFHDFRMQTQVIVPTYTKQTPHNSAMTRIPVRTGSLILFPAWLPHSVEPNRANEIRVSLSFNLMFTEYTEKLSPPSWQGGRAPTG